MATSTAAAAAGDDVVGPRKQGGGNGGTTPPPPPQQQQQPEQGPRCPRCDSPNTKFCYYNNYSLSQPRHFCKTCRRYWTKGGALRNVPVGGGCRKNKRSRSAASSRLSLNPPVVEGIGTADQQGLGFFSGGDPVVSSPIGGAPAAQHQVAAVGMMAVPRLHHAPMAVGHYVPFEEWPSGTVVDVTGGGNGGHAMSGGHVGAVSSSIASSIESLSFINQDLHWKLQQQRLATMFLGPPPSSAAAAVHVEGAPAVPEHISGPFLQMGGATSMEAVPATSTSWFMDSSYVQLPPPAANTAAATNGNVQSGRSNADDDNDASNRNCGSAIPAWADMSTFTMLP